MKSTDGSNQAGPNSLPLVVHIVHTFDYGGLENGLVNIINTMDPAAFRHVVISLVESAGFERRITRRNAEVYSLKKKPGKDFGAYYRLWVLLRKLRPSILHTRNIGTLDCALVGRLAGIRVCVHGEHGWDTHDPDGKVIKFRVMRRVMSPLLTRFITVSEDLANWLVQTVGISAGKITAICNGVDTEKFRPCGTKSRRYLPENFVGPKVVVVGTVSRFQAIKDPLNLVRAFITAHKACRQQGIGLRLVMLGDGILKSEADALIKDAGVAEDCWLPGMRDDVADLVRDFDIFVLASKREGISNTILEALASGLPVIATRTGGNVELVSENVTGQLVEPEVPEDLAAAIVRYALDEQMRHAQGVAARTLAVRKYSLVSMVDSYQKAYSAALS